MFLCGLAQGFLYSSRKQTLLPRSSRLLYSEVMWAISLQKVGNREEISDDTFRDYHTKLWRYEEESHMEQEQASVKFFCYLSCNKRSEVVVYLRCSLVCVSLQGL